MASTYSNLKIQLMTTGENSTTWGDVTNVNLGTALEEAIVGSDDVTFASANVTLTLSNTNASQTARNMRLRCTGTTGGSTRNLVVPAIEKPYIVQNDCADSIVIKTSAGNGITVPAGKTMWVYNNGTDVVDATTHLTSLTLASALPVLSGGTGSNTASGARTNLGLGTIATQNSNAVTITGGSITGITDLAVADGGTGASNAGDARTNLGLGSLAVLSSINNSNWSGTALAYWHSKWPNPYRHGHYIWLTYSWWRAFRRQPDYAGLRYIACRQWRNKRYNRVRCTHKSRCYYGWG